MDRSFQVVLSTIAKSKYQFGNTEGIGLIVDVALWQIFDGVIVDAQRLALHCVEVSPSIMHGEAFWLEYCIESIGYLAPSSLVVDGACLDLYGVCFDLRDDCPAVLA